MAGTKGKVGGRAKGGIIGTRVCDFCGKSGIIEKEIFRIKHVSSKGKSRMAWACRDGLCR